VLLRRSVAMNQLPKTAFCALLLAASSAHAGGFVQGAKLYVDPGYSEGWSVALSSDGNTAILGAPGSTNTSGAYVFTRTNGVWSATAASLNGSPETTEALQGSSVALSSDGTTAAVGGAGDASNVGAAWVFTLSNGTWSQQGGKLVGSGASGSPYLGRSIALSSDGNTLAVGGPYDNGNTGAVWVFTRSNGSWSPQGPKLVGSGAVGAAQQGQSVALSSDGNTLLVGGTADNGFIGAAWVFTRSGSTWSPQGPKLVATGASVNPQLGVSAALSSDGSTALVGGAGDNGAWVFTRSGSTWSQQGGKLAGTEATGNANQGVGVALTPDGNTALVGGPADDSSNGAVWVFTRSGGSWTQEGTKLLGTGAGAQMGQSVAISSDGKTVLAGGWADRGNPGAAWTFLRACSHGDANGDGSVDVSDVFFLINALFAGGPLPACY
jgi:hypothetical protein